MNILNNPALPKDPDGTPNDFFDTAACSVTHNCGKCHSCGTLFKSILDGEEWCGKCGQYRRYPSHAWVQL